MTVALACSSYRSHAGSRRLDWNRAAIPALPGASGWTCQTQAYVTPNPCKSHIPSSRTRTPRVHLLGRMASRIDQITTKTANKTETTQSEVDS